MIVAARDIFQDQQAARAFTVRFVCMGLRKNGEPCGQVLFRGKPDYFVSSISFKCPRCHKITVFD